MLILNNSQDRLPVVYDVSPRRLRERLSVPTIKDRRIAGGCGSQSLESLLVASLRIEGFVARMLGLFCSL